VAKPVWEFVAAREAFAVQQCKERKGRIVFLRSLRSFAAKKRIEQSQG
jgi:hypothetical protein